MIAYNWDLLAIFKVSGREYTTIGGRLDTKWSLSLWTWKSLDISGSLFHPKIVCWGGRKTDEAIIGIWTSNSEDPWHGRTWLAEYGRWSLMKCPAVREWRTSGILTQQEATQHWVNDENGYPLQYSGLENSMDSIVHGVANSQTQLNNFHFYWP